MRRVSASCSGRASSAVQTFRPWSSKLLTRVVAQAMRLVVAVSSRRSLVGRVRAVRGSARTGAGAAGGRGPTGVRRRTGSSRPHVSPGHPRARRGRPSGRAAGPRWSRVLPSGRGRGRVLVPGVSGRDRAHPGGLPVGRPFLHRPLRPLDRLSDDARIGATGGVQDRLGLHPGEHATAGTPPPPDQDGGLLPGRPRPARPHRIRNSTGNPRKTRFRFMPAIELGLSRVLNKLPRCPTVLRRQVTIIQLSIN